MHAVHVNHKNVKTALSSMINWSQRTQPMRCLPPGVQGDQGRRRRQAGGPYRTYAQVVVRCAR